jgi:hypothetical protein
LAWGGDTLRSPRKVRSCDLHPRESKPTQSLKIREGQSDYGVVAQHTQGERSLGAASTCLAECPRAVTRKGTKDLSLFRCYLLAIADKLVENEANKLAKRN